MLIPYNTDAPIYHPPIATVVLIVINIATFFGTVAIVDEDSIDRIMWLMLQFDTINPLQWLTNNFMHADILHLIGNMFFLWAFGLIVEGKLGWLRFSLIYLLIGVVEGALVQIPMFLIVGEGMSLGASGILFGIMGMAVLWAPQNVLLCVFWFIYPRLIDVPIIVFGAIYIALNVLGLVLNEFTMSSELLHMTGLVIGAPIGLVMLKQDWVDCEGWDFISVYVHGETGKTKKAKTRRSVADAQQAKQARNENQQQQVTASVEIERAARNGQYAAAIALFKKQETDLHGGKKLSDQALLALSKAMQSEKQWHDLVPILLEILRRFPPEKTTAYRIKLAQILVQIEERPRQAVAVLKKLPSTLPDERKKQVAKIVHVAKQQVADGAVEIEIHDW